MWKEITFIEFKELLKVSRHILAAGMLLNTGSYTEYGQIDTTVELRVEVNSMGKRWFKWASSRKVA